MTRQSRTIAECTLIALLFNVAASSSAWAAHTLSTALCGNPDSSVNITLESDVATPVSCAACLLSDGNEAPPSRVNRAHQLLDSQYKLRRNSGQQLLVLRPIPFQSRAPPA